MGCHFLLQGIFPTQESNLHLLDWQVDSLLLSHHGSPSTSVWVSKWVKSLSCVQLFATPWTAAYQAPPSMGFSRQEHWSGVPEDLPNPGVEPRSPALQVDSLPIEPLGNPKNSGMGSALLQWIFRTQESNQGLSRILEWVAHSFFRVSSPLRDWTRVSCIAGGYFTSWDTRENPKLSLKAVLRIAYLVLFSLRSKSTRHLDETSLASWAGFTFPSWTDLGRGSYLFFEK